MEQTNVELQLELTIASRKKLYVTAKWFNLASMFSSILLFIIFLGSLVTVSSKIKDEIQPAVGAYTVLMVISIINVISSFIFWFNMRQIVLSVGNLEEVSQTAFGIFNLIFGNWISGILILIASSSFNNSKILRVIVEQQKKEL